MKTSGAGSGMRASWRYVRYYMRQVFVQVPKKGEIPMCFRVAEETRWSQLRKRIADCPDLFSEKGAGDNVESFIGTAAELPKISGITTRRALCLSIDPHNACCSSAGIRVRTISRYQSGCRRISTNWFVDVEGQNAATDITKLPRNRGSAICDYVVVQLFSAASGDLCSTEHDGNRILQSVPA